MIAGARTANLALCCACIAGPAVVYALLFRGMGREISIDMVDRLPATVFQFRAPSAPAIMADLAAREAFFIATIALVVIAMAAIAHALTAIWRDKGAPGLLLGGAMALGLGGGAAGMQGNPLRHHVVEEPMRLAREAGALFAPARAEDAFWWMITIATFAGLSAVGALVARLALLCLNRNDTAPSLTDRHEGARIALIFGGLILTGAAVSTYFYYHYPLSLMTAEAAQTFAPLSGIAAVRWGATYTIILILAALPAFAAIMMDARRALAAEAITTDQAASLINLRLVLGGPGKALTAILATLAPAAISPILGVVETLLK